MFRPLKVYVFIIISTFFMRAVFNTVIVAPKVEDTNYCKVTIHDYLFDFIGLSNNIKDNKISFGEKEYLRVHFCESLLETCNGTEGYAVCLHRGAEEIGAGIEPPIVEVKYDKIIFKYSGEKCNATHNYTVNFEMKCDFNMKNETALDTDYIHDHGMCEYDLVIDTSAACIRRKKTDCTAYDKTGYYNLSPLTDLTKNYEANINHNLTVILNVCHSLVFGEHYKGCDHDTAICLINKTDPLNARYKNLGKLDELSLLRIVDQNLTFNYVNGDPCDETHPNTSQPIRSSIAFICDLDAVKTVPEYVEEESEACNYRFVWRTIAACSEQALQEKSLASSGFCYVKDPLTNFDYDLTVLRDKVYKGKKLDGHYEVSICSPLKHTECKIGTGVCRLLDWVIAAIPMGIANGDLTWSHRGPYLNYTDGDTCIGDLRKFTLIRFTCGRDALYITEESCHTLINYVTEVVCKKPCGIAKYDINLERLVRSTSNYVIKANNTRYYMNICRSLVREPHLNCSHGVGVCKATIDDNGNFVNYTNLGYPDDKPFFSSDGIIVLKYRNGSVCPEDSTRKLSSHIQFLCDLHTRKGAPEFKYYSNCVYYFEWRSEYSCSKLDVDKNCLVSNGFGDVWDLGALTDISVNHIKKTYHEQYYVLSVCGHAQLCEGSFVCDEEKNFGRKMTVMSDYTKNFIRFKFSNGSRCRDGSRARSVLNIQCDFSSKEGKPVLVSEESCSLEFEWVTSSICAPQNYKLSSANDSTAIVINNLSFRKKPIISVGLLTAILIILFLIVVAYGYFRNATRRAMFSMNIYNFISKYNLCRQRRPATEELGL